MSTRKLRPTSLFAKNLLRILLIASIATGALTAPTAQTADKPSILLQSTTSTANSGLYDFLLPHFTADSGVTVHVVAVGTGQAIRNARNCDGDVLLVHAREAEEQFVAAGFGNKRHNLMYNDFVFIGPSADPAALSASSNAREAINRIATHKAVFTSRGDNSGTHKKEQSLWRQAGLDTASLPVKWYRQTGSGMGATLNITVGMQAYTLTDRATWLNFKNRQQHKIVYAGDPALFNQYGIIAVNERKCPNVKTRYGAAFIRWMTSQPGQQLIASYSLQGEQLFFPNADNPSQ